MLDADQVDLICRARHGDPFSVLGLHADGDGGLWLRAMQPDATLVTVIDTATSAPLAGLALRDARGLFEGRMPRNQHFAYRLRVDFGPAHIEIEDPYRFGPVLGDTDLWLLSEGTHRRPFEALGAHPRVIDGVAGTAFSVWAPNALRVSVTGDFNHWDGRRHPMRKRPQAGVWEIFLPGVAAGARYKYEICSADGSVDYRSDPFGRQAELRPANASVVAAPLQAVPMAAARARANAHDAPISIYEVHLPSWRRAGGPDRFAGWDELADTLAPYAADLGFTHIELLPVSEHPLDESWGYQPVGLYAPTARHGDPAGLRRFVARCHGLGLGVLLDWVPAHFPSDPHGLARFDGTHLYEHADPREGRHPDWGTLIFNYGRREVRNYLVGNALYWLEQFGIDGLRVDAVASMLYRDYSRAAGAWVPNARGGRENLEAIDFLRCMNDTLHRERPGCITIAEESTAFAGVSRPTGSGGLGFDYKWNMGWMHDTLRYFARDPVHRAHHQNELTFGLVYAFHERFVLPLSHDEVVHGKGSLLSRMPGDRWQAFANLRALMAFMWAHPGKKLLFMGSEFAQPGEWDDRRGLDWNALADPMNAGVQRLVRDLNRVLRQVPALHEQDFDHAGFEWIDYSDAAHSVISFLRIDRSRHSVMLSVCNLTPVVRQGYRVGVPAPGTWMERINTDSRHYGGSDVGTPLGAALAQPAGWHHRPYSIEINLPPLATVLLEWTR
jgi:1,4-alpha-glucan branching enzyme